MGRLWMLDKRVMSIERGQDGPYNDARYIQNLGQNLIFMLKMLNWIVFMLIFRTSDNICGDEICFKKSFHSYTRTFISPHLQTKSLRHAKSQ